MRGGARKQMSKILRRSRLTQGELKYNSNLLPPPKIAAAPIPLTTRPRMKIEELGDRADMSDPVSNRSKAQSKTYLIEKNVYILPKEGCKAMTGRRYAPVYHPMSAMEWN